LPHKNSSSELIKIRHYQRRWRAVYPERGKYGSGRGLCKPIAVMRQGGTLLLYLSNEGISILENTGKIGLPIPGKLKNILEQLREDESNG